MTFHDSISIRMYNHLKWEIPSYVEKTANEIMKKWQTYKHKKRCTQ
jgi:hypothetical protein